MRTSSNTGATPVLAIAFRGLHRKRTHIGLLIPYLTFDSVLGDSAPRTPRASALMSSRPAEWSTLLLCSTLTPRGAAKESVIPTLGTENNCERRTNMEESLQDACQGGEDGRGARPAVATPPGHGAHLVLPVEKCRNKGGRSSITQTQRRAWDLRVLCANLLIPHLWTGADGMRLGEGESVSRALVALWFTCFVVCTLRHLMCHLRASGGLTLTQRLSRTFLEAQKHGTTTQTPYLCERVDCAL